MSANDTLLFNDERQEVAGVIASSALDRDGEVFDYDGSKKYFQEWSEAVHDATSKTVGEDNASFGNVRLMHTKQVAGKLTDIQFRDADKTVWGIAKITDAAIWQQIKEGVYSAFSVGANLVNTAYKEGKKLITISPVEVSVVDYPSNPTTTFDWIKGTVTTVSKFAGSTIPPDAKVDEGKTPESPLGPPDASQTDSTKGAETMELTKEQKETLTKAAEIFKLDVMKAGRLSLADHLTSLKKAATAHKDAAAKHEAEVHDLCDKCMKMAGGDLLLAPAETEGGQHVDIGEAVSTAVKAAKAEIEKAAKETTDKLAADLKAATDKVAELEKAAKSVTGDRKEVVDTGTLTDEQKREKAKTEKAKNIDLAKSAWINGDAAAQRELFKKLAVVTAR